MYMWKGDENLVWKLKKLIYGVEASIKAVVCEVLSSDNIFCFVRVWCINVLMIWEMKFVFLFSMSTTFFWKIVY